MLPIERIQERRSERRTLVKMLAAALVLRVALGSFIDASGFDTDLMQSWTRTLLNAPLDQFYAVAEGPDHLPGDLWFLWLIGHGLELFGLENAPRGPFVALMKLVLAVADVAIAWELFVLLRPFATSRAALIVAGAFAFNPGGIFLTSIWGQWDAVSMALLLGGLLVILKATSSLVGQPRHPERVGEPVLTNPYPDSNHRHPERSEGSPREALGGVADVVRGPVRTPPLEGPASPGDPSSLRSLGMTGGGRGHDGRRADRRGVLGNVPLWPVAVPLFTWAVLSKPPLALVAAVFLLYACVRTIQPASAVRGAIGRLASAIITSLVLGVATASLILLPFDVGLPGMSTRWDVLERARFALDLYPFTTLQAANIWMIRDAHLYRPSDLDGTLLGLTERTWGSLLLALALAWIVAVVVVVVRWRVVHTHEVTLVIWAALATSYAIFMLPTRVHERYFFPVMVLALALAGFRGGSPPGWSVRANVWSAIAGHLPGCHRGVPDDAAALGRDRWTWWLAIAISGVFLVSLLIAYTPTVNAIRAALFDVPLSFLFRVVAVVNLGLFLGTMTLPLWWGRTGYTSR